MTPTKEKFHPIRSWGTLFMQSFNALLEDHAMRFSAALAYYSIFSMAPLVMIAISVAGLVFGDAAARGEIFQQIQSVMGPKQAREIQSIIQSSSNSQQGWIGAAIGFVTLLIGASGVFGQLKDALNAIWGVRLRPGLGIMGTVRQYLLSFGMVLAIGFLLIVSLLLSAVLQAMQGLMKQMVSIPGFAVPLEAVVSLAVLVLLFALIFKLLPDAEIAWRDVWIGSVVTSVLFTIGKYLIGLYLGRSSVASGFGAAGALILILVWIYYSATVFFLGAEFTKTYAMRFGGGMRPASNACLVSESVKSPP